MLAPLAAFDASERRALPRSRCPEGGNVVSQASHRFTLSIKIKGAGSQWPALTGGAYLGARSPGAGGPPHRVGESEAERAGERQDPSWPSDALRRRPGHLYCHKTD
jgi:hypothetical protein